MCVKYEPENYFFDRLRSLLYCAVLTWTACSACCGCCGCCASSDCSDCSACCARYAWCARLLACCVCNYFCTHACIPLHSYTLVPLHPCTRLLYALPYTVQKIIIVVFCCWYTYIYTYILLVACDITLYIAVDFPSIHIFLFSSKTCILVEQGYMCTSRTHTHALLLEKYMLFTRTSLCSRNMSRHRLLSTSGNYFSCIL